MLDGVGRPQHVLVLGGTSELALASVRAMNLAPGARVVLAGRDENALRAAAAAFPRPMRAEIEHFDARDPASVLAPIDRAFGHADVDVVVSAFGQLGEQSRLEAEPAAAAELMTVNATSQVVALLAVGERMRRQGHGLVVVLSSVAAVRPRRSNFVYGASKAAVDAAATGLADSLRGSGVDVVVVRPGFVVGRMTAGRPRAPLPTTPEAVGAAVADAVRRRRRVVWVPPALAPLAVAMRLAPRTLWRRLAA